MSEFAKGGSITVTMHFDTSRMRAAVEREMARYFNRRRRARIAAFDVAAQHARLANLGDRIATHRAVCASRYGVTKESTCA